MVHLNIALTLVSIAGVALLIARLYKLPFALSFLYSHIFIALFCFVGGLFQVLEVTAEVLRFIGVGLFFIFIVPLAFSGKLRTPRFSVAFLLCFILLFYVQTLSPSYASFYSVDDYNHWGQIGRFMTWNDRFLISTDPIGLKDYPPGLTLIQYFYTNFTGYQPNISLFAQGAFNLSLLAFPLVLVDQRFTKFNLPFFSLLSLLCLSLSFVVGRDGFHTLQADLSLGLLFGTSLLLYFVSTQKGSRCILVAMPLLLMLPLVKQIGLVFFCITLSIIFLEMLFIRGGFGWRQATALLFIFSAGLGLDAAWRNYLEDFGISRVFEAKFTFFEAVRAFNPAYASEHQASVLSAFLKYFFLETHTATYWFLLGVLTLFATYLLTGSISRRVLSIRALGSGVGFVMYLALLALLYMFSFSEFEAVRLASIDRYTKTYLLGLLICFGGMFIASVSNDISLLQKRLWVGSLIFLFMMPNTGRVVGDIYESFSWRDSKHGYVGLSREAQRISALTPMDAKIYFLWSDGPNDPSVVFSYGVFPRHSNTICSNLRAKDIPATEDDPWSCSMDTDDFSKKISGYDYLYIGRSSETLKKSFLLPLGVKEIQAGDLFSIVKGLGTVTLKKI